MNKADFIKLIDIIVEKKLNAILPGLIDAEIKKHLESGIQPDIDDFEEEEDDDLKTLLSNPNSEHPVIRNNSIKKTPQMEEKKWTKNPVINKILTETAQSFKPLPKDPTDTVGGTGYQQMLSEEYETIGDEFSFNTKNMADAINRNPVHSAKAPAVNNLKSQLLQEPGANANIVNAMVKDYSKVLKKADKISKSTRGGGMPLGQGVGEDW